MSDISDVVRTAGAAAQRLIADALVSPLERFKVKDVSANGLLAQVEYLGQIPAAEAYTKLKTYFGKQGFEVKYAEEALLASRHGRQFRVAVEEQPGSVYFFLRRIDTPHRGSTFQLKTLG